ncbi:MAG: hypothetical protein LUF86_04235 [Clostridiales bacterium]|nr:hypothetical protein [Clostridiales bacterium]
MRQKSEIRAFSRACTDKSTQGRPLTCARARALPGPQFDPNARIWVESLSFSTGSKKAAELTPGGFFCEKREKERKERRKMKKRCMQFALPCSLAASIE